MGQSTTFIGFAPETSGSRTLSHLVRQYVNGSRLGPATTLFAGWMLTIGQPLSSQITSLIPREVQPMRTLDELAHAIDAAADAGDETLLRQLGDECESRLSSSEGEDRVRILYYQSNTYYGIISSKLDDIDSAWDWDQPDGVKNLLSLRRAIGESSFEFIDPIVACQIRTNLANRLNSLGRPVAANEHWLQALEIEPRFAKALANWAKGTAFYASTLYDRGHKVMLLAAARSLFEAALGENGLWESGDRDIVAPGLTEECKRITRYLADIGYDEKFDLNQWSLGTTEEERSYRRWCLRERLFLNPLNDGYTDSIAATDVFHLPDHTYRIDEPARFPAYYNLLKQEYVSARYRLYRATYQDDPHFVMSDVLMLGGDDYQILGYCTEDLRSAFRSAYAIFDKIGLFLNDYFQIGLRPRDVTFRSIWVEKPNSPVAKLRPMFNGRPNWPLRGLYFLSKDLFDDAFEEVAEPDAGNLARLRQQIEHRFLSLQHFPQEEGTETHQLISIYDFQDKTLRLLKMAREALIYLSLGMHREETLREEAVAGGSQVAGSDI